MTGNGDKPNYGALSDEWAKTYLLTCLEKGIYGDTARELWALVQLAKPIVENDARMVADLTRFAPLPSEAQEKHDTTEYPSEKWLSDYEAFKKKWVVK